MEETYKVNSRHKKGPTLKHCCSLGDYYIFYLKSHSYFCMFIQLIMIVRNMFRHLPKYIIYDYNINKNHR